MPYVIAGHRGLVLLFAALALARPAAAQGKADDLLGRSLEELLQVEVSTASIGLTPWTRQPATLSVLTATDLRALGVRDLMGALEAIPGTSFGVDVFGTVGLVFRGNWAHEGKVLLLLDDMPVNDVLYGSLSFFKRYPIEQIDRIEVIRGAGSAKYGGNAQLAVIRVYTRQPDGVEAHLSTEQVAGAGFGRSGTASFGRSSDDWSIFVSGHVSEGPYSGRQWLDTNGDSVPLDSLTANDYRNGIVRLGWRGLRAHYFVDQQRSENPHNFGFSRDGESISFSSRDLLLDYDWEVSEHVRLQPRYLLHRQQDWFIDRDPAILPAPKDFFLPAGSDTYGLDARVSAGSWDVLAGVQYTDESARAWSPGGVAPTPDVYFAGKQSVAYQSRAAFIQSEWSSGPWNVSTGLRFSDHSFAGESFVPRLAVVFAAERWNLKAHFGRAFREPDIEVINSSDLGAGNIVPEQTTQFEVSGSWRPVRQLFGTVSLYRMTVDDPIVYSSAQAVNSPYFYRNTERVGTEGIETEWRAEVSGTQLNATYSFYRTLETPIPTYEVPGNANAHVGAPQQKLTLSANTAIPRTALSVQPSLTWYSTTPAYMYLAGASGLYGNPLAIEEIPNRLYVNLLARYRASQWDVTAGLYDLFDEGMVFPQPYQGESTPYPGPGRRIWVGLSRRW